MFLHRWLVVVLLFVSTFAFAETSTPKSGDHILCRSRTTVRRLQIVHKGELCDTLYTKDGVEKAVALGKTESTCQRVLNSYRTNLEENFWKCRDITDSRVSSSY